MNSLTSVNITEDEVVIVDNWDYIVKAADLFYEYSTSTNKKR
jgi:hypothetical protein